MNSISKALEKIVSELDRFNETSSRHHMRYVVQGVEVELAVIVEDNTAAGGGLEVKASTLQEASDFGSSAVHKIKIVLQPVISGAGEISISASKEAWDRLK